MQKVPKIVAARLRAARPPANHPDADVLTAFAEGSLPQLERAIVVEHLARCGNCREIVMLALPESQAIETPVKSASGSWFTWNALRWGFVTAGIVVAAFGVQQYRRHSRHELVSISLAPIAAYKEPENKPLPAVSAPEMAASRDPGQAAPAKQEGKSGGATLQVPKPAPGAEMSAPGVPPASGSGNSRTAAHRASTFGGPRLMQQNQWQNATVNQQQIATNTPQLFAKQSQGSAQIPQSSEAVTVAGRQEDQIKPKTDAQIALNNQRLDQQVSEGGQAEAEVERAKPAMVLGGPAKVLRAAPSSPAGVNGLLPNPKWTISSSGALQRSFDQGTTWQEVSVNGNAAQAAAATNYSLAKVGQPTLVDNEEADKKKVTPIVFRAVAANGADVWAGGSSGLLYHSTDAGSHWTRVVPNSAGVVLVGDIVSVEFPDARHGKISTSTAEVWTTGDAGQTWQKQ